MQAAAAPMATTLRRAEAECGCTQRLLLASALPSHACRAAATSAPPSAQPRRRHAGAPVCQRSGLCGCAVGRRRSRSRQCACTRARWHVSFTISTRSMKALCSTRCPSAAACHRTAPAAGASRQTARRLTASRTELRIRRSRRRANYRRRQRCQRALRQHRRHCSRQQRGQTGGAACSCARRCTTFACACQRSSKPGARWRALGGRKARHGGSGGPACMRAHTGRHA